MVVAVGSCYNPQFSRCFQLRWVRGADVASCPSLPTGRGYDDDDSIVLLSPPLARTSHPATLWSCLHEKLIIFIRDSVGNIWRGYYYDRKIEKASSAFTC